jgi:hypothetical protein
MSSNQNGSSGNSIDADRIGGEGGRPVPFFPSDKSDQSGGRRTRSRAVRRSVPDESGSGTLIELPPASGDALWNWIADALKVKIARDHVCRSHTSPWDYFSKLIERPALALVLGPRGGGKSFLSALHTHVTSLRNPNHGTRILGGSRAQSEQVYRALRELILDSGGSDAAGIAKLLGSEAIYRNGSDVAILAASSTSVRGPHVPSLKLDEVDEIDTDCREAAMGMCMARHGVPASVLMTSTWHKVGGPMANLMDQAGSGAFPLFTFCAFDVLEHCSPARSGPYVGGKDAYLKCPECPIVKWCHSERDRNGDLPLAKISHGHYAIDSLIQKVHATSERTFEADYLCKGPRVDGLWFPGFDPVSHVSYRAEFDEARPVHLSIDSGVFTGAVFFQVAQEFTPQGLVEEIHVFAEYLVENVPAEQVGRAIGEQARVYCKGRLDVISTDLAGGARNPVGPSVIAEYERTGLRPIRRWPSGSVADGLALVESFAQPADGRSRLLIHPRCTATVQALRNYRRARRGGQWQDYPEDPQHPHEDLVDAIRGGLRTCFPEGRSPKPNYSRIPARQVF